jgi:NADH-quinone oxidoreductase subunit M
VLNALLFPIGLLASANISRAKAFIAWMLLLEAALMGVFLALDMVLFFVFFEIVLVPMYFLIAGWGHENRRYAAMKFFLFTMTGSAFLFVGTLSVAFLHRAAEGNLTFDSRVLTDWASTEGNLSSGVAKWLFLAFAVAFAVKVPLFPLHTWLPDAHTDAPTAGSVILAGVLLKMGTYGFLRFAVPMFPQAAVDLAPVLLIAAVIGITYGAIVAAMQPNLKRVVAYSSVAHLGFVVLGTFALTQQSIQGGLFTMLSHGLTTGALFLLVGMLYDRRHTYEIAQYKGLWKAIPVFGGLFVIAAFASIGLPGFSGFVGEFLSLLGGFLTSRWYVVVATTGVILAAVYMLWAVQRTMMGEPDGDNVGMKEVSLREICTVVPLLGLSLFLGFYPKPVLDRVQPSVERLVHHVEDRSDYEEPDVSTEGPAVAEESDR